MTQQPPITTSHDPARRRALDALARPTLPVTPITASQLVKAPTRLQQSREGRK